MRQLFEPPSQHKPPTLLNAVCESLREPSHTAVIDCNLFRSYTAALMLVVVLASSLSCEQWGGYALDARIETSGRCRVLGSTLLLAASRFFRSVR